MGKDTSLMSYALLAKGWWRGLYNVALIESKIRPVLADHPGAHSQTLNHVFPVPAEFELAAGEAGVM